MKLKVCIFLVAVSIALSLNAAFDLFVYPTISAQLAVGQLEDSELNAAAVRGITQLQNTLPLVTWASVLLIGVVLFGSNIKTFLLEKIN